MASPRSNLQAEAAEVVAEAVAEVVAEVEAEVVAHRRDGG